MSRTQADFGLREAEGGFSLLELCLCIVLMASMLAVTLPSCTRIVSFERLAYTQRRLVADFRFTQGTAYSSGQFALLQFAMYAPRYSLYQGSKLLVKRSFLPGVNYPNGYFQLQSPQVVFDATGSAPVAGTIHLLSEQNQADVLLYMNAGLVSPGGR